MTQKELAYLEDAIGHEKTIMDVCSNNLNSLDDEQLCTFLKDEIENNQNIKEKLMNKLEEMSNE